MYRDGWYYLLGTHGTCCDGANSTYNIRAARSRKVTGPTSTTSDRRAERWRQAGGRCQRALHRPGHFGLLDLGDGCAEVLLPLRGRLDEAAAACWTSARCSGRTAGRMPATTSVKAPTRSSRSAAASARTCRRLRADGGETGWVRRTWRAAQRCGAPGAARRQLTSGGSWNRGS